MALQEELESQGNFLFKYRGLLPIVILLVGIGVFVYRQFTDASDDNFYTSEAFTFICLLVSFIGFFIRVYTVGHTPENTSGRNTQVQVADQVNTTGIYSAVRHPLYVGNFFMYLGIGMLTQSLGFVVLYVLFFWVYYERIMFAEEQFLKKKFGEVYTNWASRTPAFIPSLKNWTDPKYPFSWKKVLKKEKNGFFALFVVFYLFDFIEANIKMHHFIFEANFWFYAMIIAAVAYFILKYLKSKTELLHEKGR
ncbi:MAG: lipid A phosphate methyltransferase [Bacteroidota bacterium]|nr:lipid A phosphate methyltransferase [Bacteroidota bacterium]